MIDHGLLEIVNELSETMKRGNAIFQTVVDEFYVSNEPWQIHILMLKMSLTMVTNVRFYLFNNLVGKEDVH